MVGICRFASPTKKRGLPNPAHQGGGVLGRQSKKRREIGIADSTES